MESWSDVLFTRFPKLQTIRTFVDIYISFESPHLKDISNKK